MINSLISKKDFIELWEEVMICFHDYVKRADTKCNEGEMTQSVYAQYVTEEYTIRVRRLPYRRRLSVETFEREYNV